MNNILNNHFACMSREQLIKEKALYEKIIAEQHPDYFIVTKNGKRVKPSKMPWMIPVWQKGLDMVNNLLSGGGAK